MQAQPQWIGVTDALVTAAQIISQLPSFAIEEGEGSGSHHRSTYMFFLMERM